MLGKYERLQISGIESHRGDAYDVCSHMVHFDSSISVISGVEVAQTAAVVELKLAPVLLAKVRLREGCIRK